MSLEGQTCAVHPDRETGLRCNRCGTPICPECAVQTPVGYRCTNCVRSQQAVFETAYRRDFFVAIVVSALGVAIAIFVLRFLGFWGLLLAPVLGGGLAEIVRVSVGRRRSRNLPRAVIVGGVLGMLPHVALPGIGLVMILLADPNLSALAGVGFSLLYPLAYGALMTSAVYARLKGISL